LTTGNRPLRTNLKKARILSFFPAGNSSIRLHMKPTATTGFIAMRMDNPALEIEDFDRLVEQYRTRVLRFVFSSVRDMDLAETLTQDCFWRAYKSRHSFRGDCAMYTWLAKIAVNLVRDHTRSRRFQFWKKAERIQHDEIRQWPDRGISPEQTASMNQQVQQIWEATKTLSERQRTVFFLRFVEEMDVTEIAVSTGLTPSTVNVHLVRAVQGIRKRLGNRYE
jgi:RNA polymerase sigma-70 factor (ECF subfamily)